MFFFNCLIQLSSKACIFITVWINWLFLVVVLLQKACAVLLFRKCCSQFYDFLACCRLLRPGACPSVFPGFFILAVCNFFNIVWNLFLFRLSAGSIQLVLFLEILFRFSPVCVYWADNVDTSAQGQPWCGKTPLLLILTILVKLINTINVNINHAGPAGRAV
jgi:hypothetical protein